MKFTLKQFLSSNMGPNKLMSPSFIIGNFSSIGLPMSLSLLMRVSHEPSSINVSISRSSILPQWARYCRKIKCRNIVDNKAGN